MADSLGSMIDWTARSIHIFKGTRYETKVCLKLWGPGGPPVLLGILRGHICLHFESFDLVTKMHMLLSLLVIIFWILPFGLKTLFILKSLCPYVRKFDHITTRTIHTCSHEVEPKVFKCKEAWYTHSFTAN